MSSPIVTLLLVLAMIVIIVAVDVAFLRNRFWERLFINIGIVAIFAVVFLRFLHHP